MVAPDRTVTATVYDFGLGEAHPLTVSSFSFHGDDAEDEATEWAFGVVCQNWHFRASDFDLDGERNPDRPGTDWLYIGDREHLRPVGAVKIVRTDVVALAEAA